MPIRAVSERAGQGGDALSAQHGARCGGLDIPDRVFVQHEAFPEEVFSCAHHCQREVRVIAIALLQ